MGIREMLILVLGLAVVAVILRGLYLALQARRGQIRLAIDKNIPQDVDLDELEMAELPTGGARVVQRSLEEVNRQNTTQDELDLGGEAEQGGPIPILMDTVEIKESRIGSTVEETVIQEGGLEFPDELRVEQNPAIQEDEQQAEDDIYDASDDESYSREDADYGAQEEVVNEQDIYDSAPDNAFAFDYGSERKEPELDLDSDLEGEFGEFSMTADDRIGGAEASQQVSADTAPSGEPVSKRSLFGRLGKKYSRAVGNTQPEYQEIKTTIDPVEAVASTDEPPVATGINSDTGGITDINQVKESRKSAAGSVATPVAQSPVGPSEVLVINVMSREGYLFRGPDLLQVLLTAGLNHGDMNIFHKHVSNSVEEAIVFSVANILNPGTFDLDNMDGFTTRGVSLFLPMPATISNLEAFEQMLKTAQQIRGALDGELRDDHRNVMTAQTIEHYRQRIHDFELQKLKAAQAHS